MARKIQGDPLFSCKAQSGKIPGGYPSKSPRFMKMSMEKRFAQLAQEVQEKRKGY